MCRSKRTEWPLAVATRNSCMKNVCWYFWCLCAVRLTCYFYANSIIIRVRNFYSIKSKESNTYHITPMETKNKINIDKNTHALIFTAQYLKRASFFKTFFLCVCWWCGQKTGKNSHVKSAPFLFCNGLVTLTAVPCHFGMYNGRAWPCVQPSYSLAVGTLHNKQYKPFKPFNQII